MSWMGVSSFLLLTPATESSTEFEQARASPGILIRPLKSSGNRAGQLGRDPWIGGSSDPSSSENRTGIICFIVILPFGSFSATTSC